MKVKDQVRKLIYYKEPIYIYGEITLIGTGYYEGKIKVMWGSPFYDYCYENPNELELMLPEHTSEGEIK